MDCDLAYLFPSHASLEAPNILILEGVEAKTTRINFLMGEVCYLPTFVLRL